MPLYEYQCESCGHRFEVIRKFSDAPLETCEKCGGAVIKLPSSPAIQFKGSGWYITDYARAGKSDAPKAEAGKSEPAAATSESKSDSKGESKGEKSESKTETKTETKSSGSSKAPATS